MSTNPLALEVEAMGREVGAREAQHLPGLHIEPPAPSQPNAFRAISLEDIRVLYTKYLEVLGFEVGLLGVSPTEPRHLIGRLGEFYCALDVGGSLARTPNEPGFDVIAPNRRRISVKTTAQTAGFVAISKSTIGKTDDLMVLQHRNGDISKVFHGPIRTAVEAARFYGPSKNYELDLSRARKLHIAISTPVSPRDMTQETPREAFEKALQPFATLHGLAPIWHSDLLLSMEPTAESASANVCLEFEPGYWALYAQRDVFIQERAREQLVGQLAVYRSDGQSAMAQVVRAALTALAPLD